MYTYVAGQCGHETGESTRTTAVSWLNPTRVLENPLSSRAANFTRPIEGPRQRVRRTAVGDLVECRHGSARLTGTFIESRTYVGVWCEPTRSRRHRRFHLHPSGIDATSGDLLYVRHSFHIFAIGWSLESPLADVFADPRACMLHCVIDTDQDIGSKRSRTSLL